MDWITEHIAIGNYLDARREDLPFQAVLCLKAGCGCSERDDVDVLSVPLVDGPGNAEADVLEAVDYIGEVLREGGKILVHCHAGRSRSVCVVAAHLMRNSSLTWLEAVETIASKREVALTPGIEHVFMLVGDSRLGKG